MYRHKAKRSWTTKKDVTVQNIICVYVCSGGTCTNTALVRTGEVIPRQYSNRKRRRKNHLNRMTPCSLVPDKEK